MLYYAAVLEQEAIGFLTLVTGIQFCRLWKVIEQAYWWHHEGWSPSASSFKAGKDSIWPTHVLQTSKSKSAEHLLDNPNAKLDLNSLNEFQQPAGSTLSKGPVLELALASILAVQSIGWWTATC